MIKITFFQKAPTQKDIALVELRNQKDTYIEINKKGQKIIVLGIIEKEKIDRRKFILLSRQIIDLAKKNNIKKIAINLADFKFSSLKLSKSEFTKLLATNMEMANFQFVDYKTKPKDGWKFVTDLVLYGKEVDSKVKKDFLEGQVIAIWVNNCRKLANTPGGNMTPLILARRAVKWAKDNGVEVTVWNEKKIKSKKMGAIMGVAQGSSNKPQFIILEYNGASKKDKPIVLIGKGVTFDTGGVNIKPGKAMLNMHMDMSGGAAVISTVMLASELKVKKNIIGLIPAVENMASGTSYRTNDILKSLSGKTIEILHTDAEGRLILADSITYAKKFNPSLVVDVATLTGAAMVALGQRASVIFTKDKQLQDKIIDWGEKSGDYVWPLPLWDEYFEEIKGTFADVANASKVPYGGAITAAIFLYQFAKELNCPWVHIDIAPRMVAIDGEYLAKGAAGASVRLLINLLENI